MKVAVKVRDVDTVGDTSNVADMGEAIG